MKKLNLWTSNLPSQEAQKLTLSQLTQSDKSKKMHSIETTPMSPYLHTFSRRNTRQTLKDKIQLKSPPQSCKANQQMSISKALQSFYKEDQSKQPQTTKNSQFTNQLKHLLSRNNTKLSPDSNATAQRMNSYATQHMGSSKPLKTSPDVKVYQSTEVNRLSRQKSQNNSERQMKIEQTKMKIMALQMQLQSNVQMRQNKMTMHLSTPEDFIIKTDKKSTYSKPQLPQISQIVAKHYSKDLTHFEKEEILEYDTIYYVGNIANKINANPELENHGYDNDSSDYKFIAHDHVAYRYEMLETLGHGSFGYVYKVMDHKYNQFAALKIIKNKEKFHNQAIIEIDILKIINQADNDCCLIKLMGYFLFRGHICMVFELMGCNLYEFIAMNEFQGFGMDLIRRFAIQILQALLYLKQEQIIHCDLKPENILLKHSNKSGIKIIDFGSSCFSHQQLYTYIQSRFYRAPEIILGLPYDMQIDMWSFGCIMVELYTGHSLFQCKSEKELLYLQLKTIGKPERELIDRSQRRDKFFNNQYQLTYQIKDVDLLLQIKPLKLLLHSAPPLFQEILQWDPQRRITAERAMVHPWIIDGLPPSVKKQHVSYMKSYKSQHIQIIDSIDHFNIEEQGQGEQIG